MRRCNSDGQLFEALRVIRQAAHDCVVICVGISVGKLDLPTVAEYVAICHIVGGGERETHTEACHHQNGRADNRHDGDAFFDHGT